MEVEQMSKNKYKLRLKRMKLLEKLSNKNNGVLYSPKVFKKAGFNNRQRAHAWIQAHCIHIKTYPTIKLLPRADDS
jgi:hypothetical protein